VQTDGDPTLLAQAALALGATGGEAAIPVLRDALAKGGAIPTAIVCRALQDLAARDVPGATAAQADCRRPNR
jgi:hypothetical protein